MSASPPPCRPASGHSWSVLLHYHLQNICVPSTQMVDYPMRSSCQANEAGCCGDLHLGFFLGRTKVGVTTLRRVRSQGHLFALDHCVRDTKSPYDRRGEWYEQAENR